MASILTLQLQAKTPSHNSTLSLVGREDNQVVQILSRVSKFFTLFLSFSAYFIVYQLSN